MENCENFESYSATAKVTTTADIYKTYKALEDDHKDLEYKYRERITSGLEDIVSAFERG